MQVIEDADFSGCRFFRMQVLQIFDTLLSQCPQGCPTGWTVSVGAAAALGMLWELLWSFLAPQGPFLCTKCCFHAGPLSDGACPPTCCLAFLFLYSRLCFRGGMSLAWLIE